MTRNGYYEDNESGFGHYKMKTTLNKLELGYELTPTITAVMFQKDFGFAFDVAAANAVFAELRKSGLHSCASAAIKQHRINP